MTTVTEVDVQAVATTPPPVPVSTTRSRSRTWDPLDARWIWLAVFAAAVASRFFMVGEWSLWRDEERTIFFSQRLGRAFPDSFPLFFLAVRYLFDLTGISVLAARVLTASLGVLSVVLVYVFVKRLVNREVAILAAAFVTLSVGHLFWSQSIRYYILLLVFQQICVYCFLNGFEKGQLHQLVAVSVFLLLAVLTHLSAALLFPVFVTYVGLSILMGERGGGYNWKGYATFATPFAVASVFLATRYSAFASTLSAVIETRNEPLLSVYLLYKVVGYFGVPAALLALAAPFIGRGIVQPRVLRFFTCLSFVPILELAVTSRLAFPLWYQALVAGVGFAVLAGITLYSLRERGYLIAYRTALCTSILASLPFLYGYYTTMYGDRPRWREAVDLVRTAGATGPSPQRSIYSSSPSVVAFYLNTVRSATGGQRLVKVIPPTFPDHSEEEQWFLVENDETPPKYEAWLNERCVLVAVFEAWTGPKNRTVRVYRRNTVADL